MSNDPLKHHPMVHCTDCGHAADYLQSLELRHVLPCPSCGSLDQFGPGGRARLERPAAKPEYKDATFVGDNFRRQVRTR